LNEGIARSAADIDTVWINGYGFPSARGGPMRYVKILGLNAVPAAIRRFTDESDPLFRQPAPLLEARAAAGTFL
jgi:3-hydroxyacyl-CoA dehydrogenase